MDLFDHPLPVQRGRQGHQLLHHLVLPGGHPGAVDLLVQGLAVLILVGHALHQVQRGQNQLIHRGRHGHHVAVAVIDVPPAGRDGEIQSLLLGGHLLVLVVVDDGDVPQLPGQRDEHQHPAYQHQEDGAPEDRPLGVGAPGGACGGARPAEALLIFPSGAHGDSLLPVVSRLGPFAAGSLSLRLGTQTDPLFGSWFVFLAPFQAPISGLRAAALRRLASETPACGRVCSGIRRFLWKRAQETISCARNSLFTGELARLPNRPYPLYVRVSGNIL